LTINLPDDKISIRQPLGVPWDDRAEKKPLKPDLGNASVGKWLVRKNQLSSNRFPNREAVFYLFDASLRREDNLRPKRYWGGSYAAIK